MRGAGAGEGAFADPRTAMGLPGTRAPHVEIELGGVAQPIGDLFGVRPVVLTGPEAAGWARGAERAAARAGARVAVLRAGTDFSADQSWLRRYGIGRDGAAMVRPDSIVAWRARMAAASPEQQMEHTFRRLMSRLLDSAGPSAGALPRGAF